MCIPAAPDTPDRSKLWKRSTSLRTVVPTISSSGAGRRSRNSWSGCHSRGIVSGSQTASVLPRPRKRRRRCGLRKRSVSCLSDKHTSSVTKSRTRVEWRYRSSQSLRRCVWKTPLVVKVSVMVVDGYCLIWADDSVDKSS